MFNTEDEKQKLAHYLVYYVFRSQDSVIELHGKEVSLNLKIYKRIYDSVRARMKRVLEFHWALESLKGDTLGELNIEQLANEFSTRRRHQFVTYVQTIIFNSYKKLNWDTPEAIKPPRAGKVLVGFLLAGEFKDSCIRGEKFDNEAMKRINKDICNRMYTLILSSKLSQKSEASLRPKTPLDFYPYNLI